MASMVRGVVAEGAEEKQPHRSSSERDIVLLGGGVFAMNALGLSRTI